MNKITGALLFAVLGLVISIFLGPLLAPYLIAAGPWVSVATGILLLSAVAYLVFRGNPMRSIALGAIGGISVMYGQAYLMGYLVPFVGIVPGELTTGIILFVAALLIMPKQH